MSSLHGGWKRVVAGSGLAFPFLVMLLSFAAVQETNTGTDRNEPLSDVHMLIDPSRRLGLEEILAAGESEFRSLPRQSINLGYPREAAWLRLKVKGDPSEPALLSLSPNFIDLVDFYIGDDRPGISAGDFTHIATGDHRSMPKDGLSGLDNAVALDFSNGHAKLVYVRLASVNSTLTTDIALYSLDEHKRRTTFTALSAGLWFGSMIILIVIQLIFHYFDRQSHYLLLAAATFVAVFVYFGTLGLSRMFVFPDGGIGNDIFTAGTTWFGLSAGSIAGISILEVRRGSRIVYGLFLAAAVTGLVGVVCSALGANVAFAPFGTIASLGVTTLGMVYALYTIGEKGSATRLRAAAYTVIWCGVAATFVQRGGLIDAPNWVSHVYAAACVLQTILLTAALGVRLRTAEKQNRVMREEAVLAAQALEQRAHTLVEVRTRELDAARKTAQDALRAELASQQNQVRFMEVISHQYRTPLAAIRSHVDNIGISLPKDDAPNRKRLDRVRRGIVRLVEVLEVNLARSRVQGSSFQPLLRPASLAGLVEAAGTRGRDLLQGDIRLDIDPPCRQAHLSVDADMLDIAIINLLENAVKFSAPKGPAPVVLACKVKGDHALISVSDEGIGILSDEVDLVFEPMRRGANATDVEGTGMGLSQVARIAAAHGGSVHLESREGEGTSVTLCLPLEHAAQNRARGVAMTA